MYMNTDIKLTEDCSVIQLFSFLGKRWTLPILYSFQKKDTQTYSEVLKTFGNTINHTLLSQRLKGFIKFGILKKTETGKYTLASFGKKSIASLMSLRDVMKEEGLDFKIPKECKDQSCYCAKLSE